MSRDCDKDTPRRRALRVQIDENLKRVYADTLSEDLPDRFRDLLDTLSAFPPSGSTGDHPDTTTTDAGALNPNPKPKP